MKLNRVLIVFKHHIGGNEPGAPQPRPLARWQGIHAAALSRVQEALRASNIAYAMTDRTKLSDLSAASDLSSAELIVAVGGDGTLLAAAHAAGKIPVLGVNSMPGRSVGFFCAATVATFPAILRAIREDRILPRRLPLIEARIDGRPVETQALNDVLFAGLSPAEMPRYEIRAGKNRERQKSSGVWISAGPGSTAANLAAGGRRQPIASRRIQFVVREPHRTKGSGYRLLRAILSEGETIAIRPEIIPTAIYLDGPAHTSPLPAGSTLTLRIARQTLSLFLP